MNLRPIYVQLQQRAFGASGLILDSSDLEQEGLKVIRFENKELYDNLGRVLETIKQALQK